MRYGVGGWVCFPTEKSILNALFRVICRAELERYFWFGYLFVIFSHDRPSCESATCHQLSPLTANQCILGLAWFRLSLSRNREFITVLVRIKIGANMNLAVANPGQHAWADDNPADGGAVNFECWFSVLPVPLTIVFASRRRNLFLHWFRTVLSLHLFFIF